MTILEKIIQHKKQEVAQNQSSVEIRQLEDAPFYHRPNYSLEESLVSKTGIISEFKRQSPSKGVINPEAKVLPVVAAYEKYGASGISILTDKEFFGGSTEDILNVRNEISIPILRKDFMIDEYQFHEAKSIGADIVLLIAACLSPQQALEFTDLAHSLGLEVLLEIHTEDELKHINHNVDFVGINNRNLKDFKVDLGHSVALKNALPEGILSIAESGIYQKEDFLFLKEKGFHGFLMGEYFMKNANPGKEFENFVREVNL